ncbi:MAG: sugar phosphate nucleotidyltransferase [Acidobacteriota bacterium]
MLQAVILAAGRSTRTFPLTSIRPKPLVPLLDKPILQHQLEQLTGLADQVILVIGYRGNSLRERFGDRFGSLPLVYVEQEEQKGTADALRQAAPLVRDRCLVMNGDDLYHRKDLEGLCRHQAGILVTHAPDPQNRAVVHVSEERVVGIVEKPPSPAPGSLCSVGAHALDKEALGLLTGVPKSARGELELPDFLQRLAERVALRCEPVRHLWVPLTYAWDVLKATRVLLTDPGKARDFGIELRSPSQVAEGEDVRIGEGTTLVGPVLLGGGTTLGPASKVIGPAVLGPDCTIGKGVEVEGSVLFRGVEVGSFSRLSNSILAERVRIGPQVCLEAVPEHGGTVEIVIKGWPVDTGLKRLGLIAGDGAVVPARARVPPGSLLAAAQPFSL